jgi:hypothetical protein
MLILTIVSLALGVASFLFALVTHLKTESYKQRVRVELIRTVGESHAFRDQLLTLANLPAGLQGRLDSFNHSITLLLSLDKKAAEDWVRKAIREGNTTPVATFEELFQLKFHKTGSRSVVNKK